MSQKDKEENGGDSAENLLSLDQHPEDKEMYHSLFANQNRKNDSFGMPEYVPKYQLSQEGGDETSSVPWYLRRPATVKKCTFFDFLQSERFWRQVEFALRITIIAVLFPASLIAANLSNLPFVSRTATISAAILASKVTVGEAVCYIFIWFRAGCIWLPLATIGAAIRIGDNIVAWSFFYTVFLFVMAVLTENATRRISLLLFNSCMVGLLLDPKQSIMFPSRVMVDWCIGTALCFLATLLPYPKFSKSNAQSFLADIARNTGTALLGMSCCFWSDSNVERNMSMTKVRMLTAAIDEKLHEYHIAQEQSFYEFFFESFELRNIRDAKVKLFERLRLNLMGLSRVLDILEKEPWVVDESERAKVFGRFLKPHISCFSLVLNNLTSALATANTLAKIKELDDKFVELNEATIKLQEQFANARRVLFYEQVPEKLEEFVPLMAFFLFSIVNFRDSLVQFNVDMKCHKVYCKDELKKIFFLTLGTPVIDNIVFFKRLVTQWRRREIQRVIEAAKVSGAMILSIGFSRLLGVSANSFSGPSNIAFVSGSNPVEALQASVVRLTACILGTVLGFFAGTISTTSIEKVGSLCTLIFIGTFLRNDKDYGIMAVYAMFVMVPLNSSSTPDDAISRLNQNTFSILIYVFVSVLVLPLSPGLILRKRRINILLQMSKALTKMCDLFSEPLPSGNMRCSSVLMKLTDASNGGAGDGNNTNNHSFRVFGRDARLNLRVDVPLEEISKILEDIERRNKETVLFMGFASEERGIVDTKYPANACKEAFYHIHRMTTLLKSIWCSWDVLRGQKMYTKDTQRILRILQPIGWDIARSFHKFVCLLRYALRDPSTVLEPELLQVVLDLINAADELHDRKNRIMISLIRSSVNKHTRHVDRTSVRPEDVTLGVQGEDNNIVSLQTSTGQARVSYGCSTDLMSEGVSLSDTFYLPVTGEDTECFHSLSLSIKMFADEAKKLLLSLKEILEHLRKKL